MMISPRYGPFLLLAGLALPVHAEIVLRAMAQESLPPKWISHHGQTAGVCPDILAAIEKIEPQLRFSGADNYRSLLVIEHGLESGRVDVACALLDTPRRRKIANIAGTAVYQVRHRLAAAAGDNIDVASMADLLKLKPDIATARGAGYAEQLRAMGLVVDDSTGDNLVNLKKIAAGHGRLFYMNELTMNWIVRENKLGDKVRILPAVLKEEPIYFWTSKKTDPAAAHLMDQALHKLKANGTLGRIYEHWSSER